MLIVMTSTAGMGLVGRVARKRKQHISGLLEGPKESDGLEKHGAD
jgi:hypothetical protein